MSETDIAIIGMSCRFPGADNIEQFWQNLKNGIESVTFFSDEELINAGVEPALLSNPNYVKANAILSGIESFDASFFGYNPREAEMIDPQQRFFLEEAWKTIENAGYDPERYEGLIGVYAGAGMNTYLLHNLYSGLNIVNISGTTYQLMISNDKDFLPTRVSYKLNLRGPSVSVQTACSTSLVAIHFACQSLLNGECDIALAGGVTIHLPQNTGYLYQEGMILSPDGHCRAFDADGRGIISGNGVGIVALKRMADAIADGDYIYAAVKGSAINNDGAQKVGYTAPSVEGQSAVIAEAQAIADVHPETVTYIETHGTGTVLGDPIEIAALTQTFRRSTQKTRCCAIGSVKTNFGHLDSAAGVAGFMKTALALKNKQIPPSLHFENPNPKIDFANSPFYVNTELSEWETPEIPRRAGVSSFGIGGTNAHVVLEEAPSREPSGESRSHQLLLISAKTETALETATTNLVEYFRDHSDVHLANVAYTLQAGRKTFAYRRIVTCCDLHDAQTVLTDLDSKRVFTAFREEGQHPVVFMFTGQGAQYVNMGRELYETESLFREQVDQCAELLTPIMGLDLRHILYPAQGAVKEAGERLKQTESTQAALFVIEYALARLWMKWGIRPQAVLGHSIGEYAAACIAGIFSLEDALLLVAERGRLMQQQPPGTMLSVLLPENEVQSLLGEDVSVAAVNSPKQTVVSGPQAAIETFEETLKSKGIACIRLHTSHAFHSKMMEPIVAPFKEKAGTVRLNPPQIPFISTVTGTRIAPQEAATPEYWARNLRQPVRFAEAVQQVFKEPAQILLEVGPGRTLSTLVKRHPEKPSEQVALNSIRHPREKQSDLPFLLTTLGRLWIAGARIDWNGFYADERRYRLPLPTYPFERKRYWIEPGEKARAPKKIQGKNPDIAEWFYLPVWKHSPPPQLLERQDRVEQSQSWLVFEDEYGLGRQLTHRLKQEGQTVITVNPGSEFGKLSDQEYTLNPQRPEDYRVLFENLQTPEGPPKKVVHLWSVTDRLLIEKTPQQAAIQEQLLAVGFYSLLFLAQALGKQEETEEAVQLFVISNHVQEVTGEEVLSPEKATILGPVKVIQQEYASIRCRSIDITLHGLLIEKTPQQSTIINLLLNEFTANSADAVIAYRGNHRWVQAFEPVQLAQPAEPIPSRLREGGVYLITGGLGAIGLLLAEYLAKTVRAKLILTGRSAFPDKDEWENWLNTHETENQVSQKIKRLQEIEILGGEVLVVCADVADQQQMQAAIIQAEKKFGLIQGVIHAAGITSELSFGLIQNTEKADCEQQFRPKVFGTLVLAQLFKEKNLDFCMLMSSLSSILGGLGFVAYAAANCFMDAVVREHCQRSSTPWISVNWDGWRFDKEQQPSTSGATVMKLAIEPQEGVEAFKRIISYSDSAITQIIVSTGDLQARIDKWLKLEFLHEREAPDEAEISSRHVRPEVSSSYAAPRNEEEEQIVAIWQELLGIQPIGIHDDFFELGGHSLLAVQVNSRINDLFQIDLPASTLFEVPTVAGLVKKIETLRQAAATSPAVPEKSPETEWEEGEL